MHTYITVPSHAQCRGGGGWRCKRGLQRQRPALAARGRQMPWEGKSMHSPSRQVPVLYVTSEVETGMGTFRLLLLLPILLFLLLFLLCCSTSSCFSCCFSLCCSSSCFSCCSVSSSSFCSSSCCWSSCSYCCSFFPVPSFSCAFSSCSCCGSSCCPK